MEKSTRFDYTGKTKGCHKHNFKPTGKTFVLEYVHMGACTEDEVPEVICTKCGLDYHWRHVHPDDCPVAG